MLYMSNLHFLQNQLSDTMPKNNFRSIRCKNRCIDSSKSRFYANPLLVNAQFFSKDRNLFNNFPLKKLDNHNNMLKPHTFLGKNASFKGSSAQFQDKYSRCIRVKIISTRYLIIRFHRSGQ
jgi:hypothetical protein